MARKAAHRVWMALALIPLVAEIAFAAGGASFFVCPGDHQARLACCCPGETHESPPPAPNPQLADRCCCDIVTADVPVTPAAEPARKGDIVPPPVAIPNDINLASVAPPSIARMESFVRAHGPPAPAIPVLLRKQSFLL